MKIVKAGLVSLVMVSISAGAWAQSSGTSNNGNSQNTPTTSSTTVNTQAAQTPPPFVGGVPGTPCRRNGNGPKRASPC